MRWRVAVLILPVLFLFTGMMRLRRVQGKPRGRFARNLLL